MFRHLILGLLRDGVPRHGYALVKAYRERSGIRLCSSNFYRELQRLTAEGLVSPATASADDDMRRAPYVVTAAGRAAFNAWLVQADAGGITQYEDEMSVRALFVDESSDEAARRFIEGWREDLWAHSKVLERAREAVLHAAPHEPLNPRALVLARQLKHVAVEIEFLDALRLEYQRTRTADARTRASKTASQPSLPKRIRSPRRKS
jgi:DNA-binding PadR family transcriptional regulator